MINTILRMLHPHLHLPLKPFSSRFLSVDAWQLLKNSVPHLFPGVPSASPASNSSSSSSPNLVLVVHGIGPQVKRQHNNAFRVLMHCNSAGRG
jgi:hypothetical protein